MRINPLSRNELHDQREIRAEIKRPAGAITITDDAPGSPQTISLSGTGTVAQLSTRGLDFGNQKVGTTSKPQAVTITNVGAAPLTFTGIGLSGNFADFIETTTCGSSLGSGQSCTITLRFKPTTTGLRQASVSIGDDGGGSPQRVIARGTGT